MKTLHKVLITAGSLCLVAAIVVIGVFAFTSQTFSISNTIGFTAGKNVVADVVISANNTGTAIDINGEAEGNNRTLSFDGEEIADGNTPITVPNQTLGKRTDYVETVITITNNGTDDISATLNTTTLTANINQNLEATVTYTLEGNTSTNGATISQNEVFVITVRITLTSQLNNVNWTSSIVVALATVEEQQGGNDQNSVEEVDLSLDDVATLTVGETVKEIKYGTFDFQQVENVGYMAAWQNLDFGSVFSTSNGETYEFSEVRIVLSASDISGQINNGILSVVIDLEDNWTVTDNGSEIADPSQAELTINTDYVKLVFSNDTDNVSFDLYIFIVANTNDFVISSTAGGIATKTYKTHDGKYFVDTPCMQIYMEQNESVMQQAYIIVNENAFTTTNGHSHCQISVVLGTDIDDEVFFYQDFASGGDAAVITESGTYDTSWAGGSPIVIQNGTLMFMVAYSADAELDD